MLRPTLPAPPYATLDHTASLLVRVCQQSRTACLSSQAFARWCRSAERSVHVAKKCALPVSHAAQPHSLHVLLPCCCRLLPNTRTSPPAWSAASLLCWRTAISRTRCVAGQEHADCDKTGFNRL
jgi:hypothetical protein